MSEKKYTEIYTDGSCLKNPNGPGGWAFILLEEDKHWIVSGNNSSTTNNRMELTAVIESLKFFSKKNCIIYTDSKYTKNCAEGKWKRKKNLDLWKEYEKYSKNKNISFVWVKAHNGNYYNEKVDRIAFFEAKSIKN